MKNKSPKLTNKQIEYNLARIYQENGQLAQVVDSLGTMIVKYIEFKGDKDKFAEYCKPKEENGQPEKT